MCAIKNKAPCFQLKLYASQTDPVFQKRPYTLTVNYNVMYLISLHSVLNYVHGYLFDIKLQWFCRPYIAHMVKVYPHVPSALSLCCLQQ